ncbi:glycosyltransferase [Bradyrhizobium sp.]|uniref:glycosyltransferase n=1 Tax=Bradyrhizobium sp. TaxID=376 RepID=UPI0039E5185C
MKRRPLRAMWLLNHGTARKFEVPMLKQVGIEEVFLPKVYPADPSFRSASVDYSEDQYLTIPPADLDALNRVDWYKDPGVEAWQTANAHFDVLFFILLDTRFLKSMTRHFRGVKVWRTYGLQDPPKSYSHVLNLLEGWEGPSWSHETARNFWFGQGYSHLAEAEPRWLAERAVHLPVGLADASVRDGWTGDDKRILFVCPDLQLNSYYQGVYKTFRQSFSGLPYVVAGAQPVPVQDPNVLGYVPAAEYDVMMRRLAVMYYHSSEPNHVHYHPFEAVKAGMPLVFMAGGMLDRLGGRALPGRCTSPMQARQKLERILRGDKGLIEQIRSSQSVLLESLTADHCEPIWRSGLQKMLGRLADERARELHPRLRKDKKIAVILPVEYRGGSLKAAKLLAKTLLNGSRQDGSEAKIVFAHIDAPSYRPDQFDDLPAGIDRRPFRWRILSTGEATRAAAYAGLRGTLKHSTYMVPDDGINHLMDCDLWIVVSDRLSHPLLPVRPHLLVVHDYLQRYSPILHDGAGREFIDRAHCADAVVVTTEFTAADARQFVGLPAEKLIKLPMLAPSFSTQGLEDLPNDASPSPYFVWTTNLAEHKNHENAFEALASYYEDHGGKLKCFITGVDTNRMLSSDLPHLKQLQGWYRSNKYIRHNIRILGELSDRAFRATLYRAAFLWHPARIDNGTFSAVEAASLSVPSLSSDYLAMREMDREFGLNLSWSDPASAIDMAAKLKLMEESCQSLRRHLPSRKQLDELGSNHVARAYWQAVKEFA